MFRLYALEYDIPLGSNLGGLDKRLGAPKSVDKVNAVIDTLAEGYETILASILGKLAS